MNITKKIIIKLSKKILVISFYMKRSIKIYYFIFLLSVTFEYLSINILFVDACWGKENERLISLDVKDEHLGDVLSKIGTIAEYKIIGESDLSKLLITVSFKNLTLHQSLRRVLGNLNRFIVIDDIEKKIFLTTIGSRELLKKIDEKNKKSKTDFSDISIVPPDKDGDPPITYGDIEKLKSNRIKTDPMDVEITPSDEPGGKTVTLRDIKRKEYNPLDVEMVPPDDANERRISLREINN